MYFINHYYIQIWETPIVAYMMIKMINPISKRMEKTKTVISLLQTPIIILHKSILLPLKTTPIFLNSI